MFPLCGCGIAATPELLADKRIIAFLTLTECEWCGGSIDSRGMSWFTFQTICADCLRKEKALRRRMKEQGIDPNQYEGCGYVPEIEGADEQIGHQKTGKGDKAGRCRNGCKEARRDQTKGMPGTPEKDGGRHHPAGGADH